MPWTDLIRRMRARLLPFHAVSRLRVRTRLLAVLLPTVVGILLATGSITVIFVHRDAQEAQERLGIVQAQAVAKALEDVLAQGRRDLLFFAPDDPEPAAMRAYLERLGELRPFPYREFGYLDLEGRGHLFFDTIRDQVVRVPTEAIGDIRSSPFRLLEQGRELVPGQAGLGAVVHLDYDFTLATGANVAVADDVIRLYAPRADATGRVRGVYILGVAARDLRDFLSRANSGQFLLLGAERGPEARHDFFFDTEGRALLQPADPDKPHCESGGTGSSGSPARSGPEPAFRPEARCKAYWRMVSEVREGKSGILGPSSDGEPVMAGMSAGSMPFAPVRFQPGETAVARVVAGVASVDKSRTTLRAGHKQAEAVLLLTLSAVAVATAVIVLLSRAVTRPLVDLSRSVARIEASGELRAIELPDRDHETTVLKNAVNGMLAAMRRQWDGIRSRDRRIEQARLGERAGPDASAAAGEGELFPEIKGAGPLLDRLRAKVAKAAQVDADVLVTGEAGTGKQFVAEAIHRHSRRAKAPFLSVHCGALDETLLLDTLFGHVKGAFPEARADRAGAFLEADGGVLFLDEIQSATPHVQLALLRAIAMRRIRPLGSDRETAVNVRLIAAAAVDLAEAAARGLFREDLALRLKALAVSTPPLRNHKMSISALAHHFLKEAGENTARRGLGLSRGALAKLIAYDWPGNIRELKRCILRAAVASKHSVIQDTDLVLDGGAGQAMADETPVAAHRAASPSPEAAVGRSPGQPPLGPRQAALLPVIVREGGITRARYQKLAGAIPQRTAAHDLRQLVDMGLLVRRGSGPATRYEPTNAAVAAGGQATAPASPLP